MFLAEAPVWLGVLDTILLAVIAVLLFGLVLNLNKVLGRLTWVRRHLRDRADSGEGAQIIEALAQVQSVSLSLDRMAAALDGIDGKIDAIVDRGSTSEGAVLAQAVDSLRDGLSSLREPLDEIRDTVAKTETERLAEEIKRVLVNMGFDQYAIQTELDTLEGGSGRVQVEVAREGVKSKGYVVLQGGHVIEHKITQSYEMFP